MWMEAHTQHGCSAAQTHGFLGCSVIAQAQLEMELEASRQKAL